MSVRRTRWWLAAATAFAAFTGSVAPAEAVPVADAATPARVVTITIPARHGHIAQRWLTYPGPPRANILLPAGYDRHRRYPVLVLLNALANRYDSYVQDGIVARTVAAGFDAIVVMPEGGNGWYADWWDNGHADRPEWETYLLDDVLPAVLDRFPIRPERRFHAIAGFSMGGLGAAYLAGRLPGYFGSAASLSGFVDTQYVAPVTSPVMALLAGTHPVQDGLTPVYGPSNGFYADGHNPARLAANLRHTRVFASTGTGVPSKAGVANATVGDPAATAADAYGSVLESAIISQMAASFHRALVSAQVAVTYQRHPGGHDLPDFYEEWDAYLDWGPFRRVVPTASSWVNDTVAGHGTLWGLRYRFAAPPTQVVRFHRAGRTVTISRAGGPVTVSYRGCVRVLATPAVFDLPGGRCGHNTRR